MPEKLKMPEGLSQLLIGRPTKAVPVATAPESGAVPKEPTPEPAAELTGREQDAAIALPASAPNCGMCHEPQTRHGSGYRCDACYSKAMQQMVGFVPPTVTESAAEPAQIPAEVLVFDAARRKVYAELLQVKSSVDALLKLTFGADLMAKAVKDRVETAILEAKIANPELGEIDLAHLPDEYRLVGANRTARMGNEALTNYERPDSKATWSRR